MKNSRVVPSSVKKHGYGLSTKSDVGDVLSVVGVVDRDCCVARSLTSDWCTASQLRRLSNMVDLDWDDNSGYKRRIKERNEESVWE